MPYADFEIVWHCNNYSVNVLTFTNSTGEIFTTVSGYIPSTNAADWSVYCVTQENRIPIAAFEPAAFFVCFEYIQSNVYPVNLTIQK